MPAATAASYPPADDAARKELLGWVRTTPLLFGPWRIFKSLFKQAEADPTPDPEILGALLARLDTLPLRSDQTGPPVLALKGQTQVQSAAIVNGLLAVTGATYRWGSQKTALYRLDPELPLSAASVGETPLGSGNEYLVTESGTLIITRPWQSAAEVTFTPHGVPAVESAMNDWQRALSSPAFIASMGTTVYLLSNLNNRNTAVPLQVHQIENGKPRLFSTAPIPNAVNLQVSSERGLLGVQVGGRSRGVMGVGNRDAVVLYDISDPSQPKERGRALISDAFTWTFAGALLLVAQSDGLQVFDVSDPSRPRKAGLWTPPKPANVYANTRINVLSVLGKTAYVGVGYEAQLHQIDISDPDNPHLVAVLAAPHQTRVLGRRGNLMYTQSGTSGVSVWDVSEGGAPALLAAPPSPETVGYLKRRVRRVLHRLGRDNPALYTSVASAMLSETAPPKPDEFLRQQWATVDALFGGTNRYVQMSHGRGSYVGSKQMARKIEIRRRDERFPSAWDAHPDQAARLLNAPKAAPAAYALGVRVLRANRVPLPLITNLNALAAMLASELPLLRTVAARAVADLVGQGKSIPATTLADAYLAASPPLRLRLRPGFDTLEKGGSKVIVRHLTERLTAFVRQAGDGKRLPRRALALAALLAEKYRDAITTELLLPIAPALLSARRADLTQIVVSAAKSANAKDVYAWVRTLAAPTLTDADREPVLVALEKVVQGVALPEGFLYIFSNDREPGVQPLAWRLLASSTIGTERIAALWRQLLDRPNLTPSLESAMASAYALELLTRANLPGEEISARLQARPFLAPLLSEDTFRQLVQTVPVSVLLTLAGAVDDQTFERLKTVWLRRLREGVDLGAVWQGLPGALNVDENGQIARRILSDSDFTGALVSMPSEEIDLVLAVYEPLMDDLVTDWAERHQGAFVADSEPLTQAATSPLSRFRAWGLARVRENGLRLPVALRLMESDLPDSTELGRGFFEASEPTQTGFEYGLALADSPARGVRRYARTFLDARWDTLPHDQVFAALFEHSDPEVRGWVAGKLGIEPMPVDGGVDTTPFDRDVLRSRDTARAAKEKVKARVARTGTVDTDTLLSLARGTGTPRDAEWALGQLARRALGGEKIEGFSVDGVAG